MDAGEPFGRVGRYSAVQLIACRTGQQLPGARSAYAHELAKLTGLPVRAPNHKVKVSVVDGAPVITGGGRMLIHRPSRALENLTRLFGK